MQQETRDRLVELREQLDRLLDGASSGGDAQELATLLVLADELVHVLMLEVEQARQQPRLGRQ